MNLLEPKAWMIGVLDEELVCVSGLLANVLRQVVIGLAEAGRRAGLHNSFGSKSLVLPSASS